MEMKTWLGDGQWPIQGWHAETNPAQSTKARGAILRNGTPGESVSKRQKASAAMLNPSSALTVANSNLLSTMTTSIASHLDQDIDQA